MELNIAWKWLVNDKHIDGEEILKQIAEYKKVFHLSTKKRKKQSQINSLIIRMMYQESIWSAP